MSLIVRCVAVETMTVLMMLCSHRRSRPTYICSGVSRMFYILQNNCEQKLHILKVIATFFYINPLETSGKYMNHLL
jgi:hypothetical protein